MEKLCCFYILQLFPCTAFSVPCEVGVGTVCPYPHTGPKASAGLLNFLSSRFPSSVSWVKGCQIPLLFLRHDPPGSTAEINTGDSCVPLLLSCLGSGGGEDSQWLSLSSPWLLCHLQVTFVHWAFPGRFDAAAYKALPAGKWPLSIHPSLGACQLSSLHLCAWSSREKSLCFSAF